MRALFIAVSLLIAAVAAQPAKPDYYMGYNTCHNERTEMGKTEVMMIKEGGSHTIRCTTKPCRWYYNHMEMPQTMGNVFINSQGHMRFRSASWHNTGRYTMNMGGQYYTYHIIVMPTGMDEMMFIMPDDRVVKDMMFENMHWYNRYMKDMTFQNVKFHNVHWQMVKMENVKFVNCSFHWDNGHMYPMQAEFHRCQFEHTSWYQPHMKDCSFMDCHFMGGRRVKNDVTDPTKMYTFLKHHVHNTVFCDSEWYQTHWAYGRWYNTTFNRNHFTHHMQNHERFESHHYMMISCKDFDWAMDTMVRWTMDTDTEGDCKMMIHRPNTMMHDCKAHYHWMMKPVCGHEPSSMRFWQCNFQDCDWDHCHMDSIEWRRNFHHKSWFVRSEMKANHFVMTQHKECLWEHMNMTRWNRFTASSFHDHVHHWVFGKNVTHHSCKFYHHSWHCDECWHMRFHHCMMENMRMTDASHWKVWHMHDTTTLGTHWAGRMDNYQYCRVHHNDISWASYHMTMHEDVCSWDSHMMHHNMYHCRHRPHDPMCAHMWMSPEQHCCGGTMSCHKMPHHFWMRDNMECRDNEYEWNWRMGEWRNWANRDMYYREWSTSEKDPHSWSTHHRLPMVHCMNAMKKMDTFPQALHHIQLETPTAWNSQLAEMYSMYANKKPMPMFFKWWNAAKTRFDDHWNCLHMFEY